MKKFFKKTEGFTLVELIVVIAILGILAGVGTVGYSGYIKKANLAADQQLVGFVNQAFAAACIENGVNNFSVDDADVNMSAEHAVEGITVAPSGNLTQEKATKIEDAFDKYFAGNTATKLKTATSLNYDHGLFRLPGSGATVALPGGGNITLTPEQVALLQASTYSQDIGGLMTQVDEISALVTGLLLSDPSNPLAAQALIGFMQSEDYLAGAITAMGGTVDPNADLAALQTQYGTIVGDFKRTQAISRAAAELGIDVNDFDMNNEDHFNAYNRHISDVETAVDQNILVLGVAQSAATQSKDGAMAIINSTDPKGDLLKAMTGQGGTSIASGMGNAALVYGAFTAYASSTSATAAARTALANSTDPTAVFDLLEDEDERIAFQTYINGEQGQIDMDACIAAMGIIDNTATDPDAVNGALASGFANPDFVSALENLLK